jgi:dipeptidyl aminopeptidase/acylaminoacyl peptidase
VRPFEQVTVTAADGRPIYGFLARPPGVTSPPLIVSCHGGPTDAADPSFDPVPQVLLDAGYAVALVNYRGSTGYGAAYRDALLGAWGIVDVADVVDFALGLAALGLVDELRMAVRGGSSGGFTALAALEAQVFCGAVSLYGVTDLLRLAASCHDFEAHYLDHLIGPLPEATSTYRDRSPISHPGRLEGAILLLQGADDLVVPLDQAASFADALHALGRDVHLVVLEGEGHGFRAATSIERALTAELEFYANLFA